MLKNYSSRPAARWKGAGGYRADLLLAKAADELDTALTADTAALAAGFSLLSTVLANHSDRSGAVEDAVDEFVGELPVRDACDTRTITDWLHDRPASGDQLDRAADVVPRVAPAAIVDCGDDLLAAKEPKRARDRYRQLTGQYPDHELVARAERGAHQAKLAIQLRNVRRLLDVSAYEKKPEYCRKPAPYGGAKSYRRGGGGPYPTLMYGKPGQQRKLPSSWKARGPSQAVLVICTGPMKHGATVETCPYESKASPFGYQDVNFHNRKVPVRVYELRTGKLVRDTSVQIGGASCPAVLRYTYYVRPLGPPSDVYVKSSQSDVRAAYESLIDP